MPAQVPRAAGPAAAQTCLGQRPAVSASTLRLQSPLSCQQQHLACCKQIPGFLKQWWGLKACSLALFGSAGTRAGPSGCRQFLGSSSRSVSTWSDRCAGTTSRPRRCQRPRTSGERGAHPCSQQQRGGARHPPQASACTWGVQAFSEHGCRRVAEAPHHSTPQGPACPPPSPQPGACWGTGGRSGVHAASPWPCSSSSRCCWGGHRSTQPLPMAGLSSCWWRARGGPRHGRITLRRDCGPP